MVDQDRLVEALMNLLDNALHHTPPGGTVTVTVEQHPGTARVVVADTGAGFPPEQAALLFDRFYRTDPARSPTGAAPPGRTPGRHGSGIGLTITRAIVDAHHGTITAHSPGPDSAPPSPSPCRRPHWKPDRKLSTSGCRRGASGYRSSRT
ncbi:sensor histidine kinase [Paractinoplanes durhamensis]|uniref:sensor histidine kinase n=1 Tax=Paractinoplanes durhamensis TaxID=113563 RepID=UPI003631108B